MELYDLGCTTSASFLLHAQDAAQQYRLDHYLRRYHAQDCDAQLLRLCADWMAALLTSGVPATGGASAYDKPMSTLHNTHILHMTL